MWDEKTFELLSKLNVPKHMINRAKIGHKELWKPIKILMEQQYIPKTGWNDTQIQTLLILLSSLDSDKDPEAIRIGEREGRISTPFLANLSGNFCHGVGRSGNLTAAQPKAAGASLMQNLTNKITLSLIKKLGIPNIKNCLTLPMGTGMGLASALRGTLKYYNYNFKLKPKVLMTQIDHKSPPKGIEFIGGDVSVIPGDFGPNFYASEGSFVDIEEIKRIYEESPDQFSAIISSNCFFAPRVPDNLKKIAKFAEQEKLIHIINNAYGLQSEILNKRIRAAIDAGRVDAIVQSTDKCFLTPVGGSIVCSPNTEIIEAISQVYAGRASASPILHLLVSLLSLGENGYFERMNQQKISRALLENQMSQLAGEINERMINCQNPVSTAMTLSGFNTDQLNKLGGFLYNLRVTGPRIIDPRKNPFGSSARKNAVPFPYIVMNAAIGVKEYHIIEAIKRLKNALRQISR